jgi:hypothetical protein
LRHGGWMRHPAAADGPTRRYRTKSWKWRAAGDSKSKSDGSTQLLGWQALAGNLALDAAAQIRLFGKLKLARCARAGRRAGHFYVRAEESLLIRCYLQGNKREGAFGVRRNWPRCGLAGGQGAILRLCASCIAPKPFPAAISVSDLH